MSRGRPDPDELRARLERTVGALRQELLRYEREVDPDSAYVLSDYLDALRLDGREAAERGDEAGLIAALEDVRQLSRDTLSLLPRGERRSREDDEDGDGADSEGDGSAQPPR